MMMDYADLVNNNVVHHQTFSSIQYVIGVQYQIAFNVNIFNELTKTKYNKTVHNVKINST